MELIGLSSNPKIETVEYPNRDMIQYFTCEFYSNNFQEEIKVGKKEVKSAQFLAGGEYKEFPENEQRAYESLVFLENMEK